MSIADKSATGCVRHSLLASRSSMTSFRGNRHKYLAIVMLLAALILAWSVAAPTTG